MSGALVPSNGSSSFQQQGQVDWVSLSNSTLSFSVEILSRFSKSGVEMVTVAVGQAIFSPFKIPSEGQKRLSDAISKLQVFSSYGEVLWFGFGIKHVVRTLCETEQGAACAAICACLSVSYDTLYSSQVLREISAQSLTPTTLTPALSQWAALINVCAGAVTDSQFPLLVEGFSSLIGYSRLDGEMLPLHIPTNVKALAGALLELAKVSNGTTNSVTFEGGVDCGWIAAVAQWLFGLRLQILDHSGSHLFSNIDVKGGDEAQVTIIQDINYGNNRIETVVSSRSFVVRPGSLRFGFLSEIPLDDPAQQIFSKGRSNWSSILYDTFGSSFHDLLKREALPIFTSFLCQAVLVEYGQGIMRSPWEGYYGHGISSRLTAFLLAAAQQLPELQCVRHAAIQDPNIFKDAEALFTLNPRSDYEGGLNSIRRICTCDNCLMYSDDRQQKPNILLHLGPPSQVCLYIVAYAIFEFLWTLSWLDLHESIKPSSTGLSKMYYTNSMIKCLRRAKTRLFDHGRGGTYVYLFSLFNELESPNHSYTRTLSAACENGLCIYQSLMLLDAMPLQCLKIRVLPGQIEFNQRIYSQVSDQGSVSPPLQDTPSRYVHKIGVNPELELLVEETTTSNHLKIMFNLQRRPIPENYLGYRNMLNAVGHERWDGKLRPHNLQSIRPRMLWQNIIHQSAQSRYGCLHSKVRVSLKQHPGLEPDPITAVSWTGYCSELPPVGNPQWLPRADEWILVDFDETRRYTEAVRAKLTYIYFIVCNLAHGSQVRLVRLGECFLCSARIRQRGEQRIVIHSFLDDEVGTAVEIVCEDIDDDVSSTPVDSRPATSTPLPSTPPTSAVTPRESERKTQVIS